jgi:hypothetical protein
MLGQFIKLNDNNFIKSPVLELEKGLDLANQEVPSLDLLKPEAAFVVASGSGSHILIQGEPFEPSWAG